MGVSKNSGTPKSSILIEFSIVYHQFWGTPIFGNTHMELESITHLERKNHFPNLHSLKVPAVRAFWVVICLSPPPKKKSKGGKKKQCSRPWILLWLCLSIIFSAKRNICVTHLHRHQSSMKILLLFMSVSVKRQLHGKKTNSVVRSVIGSMYSGISTYTWNPIDPCFDWKNAFFWRGFEGPQNRGHSQVPGDCDGKCVNFSIHGSYG